MEKKDLIIAEFNTLRGEVNQRVRLLHLFILVAVLLNAAFLFMVFFMILSGVSWSEIIILLLFAPIVFSLLTFNYQANQMTLEGVSGFVNNELRKKIPSKDQKDFDQWDAYYGGYKKNFQLTSFLKVLPLLLPQTLPIWVYFFAKNYIYYPFNILLYFDLALFALVIFNFRYKIGK